MLSRAPLIETADDRMEKAINFQVHLVTSNLPATEFKLEKIRKKTNENKQLSVLKETILRMA